MKMRILGKSRKWEELAVREFYKGKPKGFRHQLLKYFYKHLQDLRGGANKERQAHAQNVRKLLENSNFQKVQSLWKWEKVLEVSRRLPPASTIDDLMSTDPAKEAITILNKRSTGHLVSSQEFISVRDFLIVRLELENV